MFNVECDHEDTYDDVDEDDNVICICYDCGEVF